MKELHRLHDQLEASEGVKIYRTKEDLAFEEAEEAGEPTDPVNFAGGGNGVRLLFDLQWWEARISNIVRHVAHGPIDRIVPWPRLAQSEAKTRRAKLEAKLAGGKPQLVDGKMPTTKQRHRLKLGTQLGAGDNAGAVHERISANLPEVIKQQPAEPWLLGWIRAVVDHLIRRQREADDEAQKKYCR